MPEEFYQVHTTNLNRPPTVSTLTPKKPIISPPSGRPNPRRSHGPIYLPANLYKLLSDVPSRSSRSTMPLIDPHLHPNGLSIPMTLNLNPMRNPLKLAPVIYPHLIPLETVIWTTLTPVKPSHLMTPSLSISWMLTPPTTLSTKHSSIMYLNTILPLWLSH